MVKRVASIVVGAMAMVLVGVGIAWASIPGADGVIHGCRKNTDGSLRAIDSAATCPNGWTSLNWAQAGGAGAQVAQVNVTVAYGQSPGTTAQGIANCPAGMAATGGGYTSIGSLDEKWVPIIDNPTVQSGKATGWQVVIEMEGTPLPPGSGNAVLTVYALCLPISLT
jgi:hypothetical protein